MEVSPFNPAARRVKGGIWNAHVLPVLEWEASEFRVVLAADLQVALGIDRAVLRWRRSKFEQVLADHAQPIERRAIQSLSAYLNRWERAGRPPGKPETWRVFFREYERWVVTVIGRDREGSMNVVTTYSPSDRNYLPNMMAKGDYLYRHSIEQEK